MLIVHRSQQETEMTGTRVGSGIRAARHPALTQRLHPPDSADCSPTSSPAPFTVLRLATITDFTPKTVTVGAMLTFTGQNLNSVTEVRFNGGTATPTVFRLSGNTLVVTVPATAVNSPIYFVNEAGQACTTAVFTISR